MKKNDKHEMYCGCRDCKRPEAKLPLLEKPEPEKQRPPEEPNAVPPDGGG